MQDEGIPRVMIGIPSRDACPMLPRDIAFATHGKCTLIPGNAHFSILTRNFNQLWADALDAAEDERLEYWLLHHDDIEIKTPAWLDLMIEEMRRVGAAILSVVVPIKGHGDQRTSTAMHLPGTWKVRKMTLEECHQLPSTFNTAAVSERLNIPGQLVVNSGVLLIDLSRKEFFRDNECGEAAFVFTILDRIVRGKDGKRKVELWSEDWEFSEKCNMAGLPVWATTAVEVIHHGGGQWSNQKECA
jgi:GT2 family glycosyltransferase